MPSVEVLYSLDRPPHHTHSFLFLSLVLTPFPDPSPVDTWPSAFHQLVQASSYILLLLLLPPFLLPLIIHSTDSCRVTTTVYKVLSLAV